MFEAAPTGTTVLGPNAENEVMDVALIPALVASTFIGSAAVGPVAAPVTTTMNSGSMAGDDKGDEDGDADVDNRLDDGDSGVDTGLVDELKAGL
jgi:hypothetical protein